MQEACGISITLSEMKNDSFKYATCDKQDLEEFPLTKAIEDEKFYSLARKPHVFQLMRSHHEISSNKFHEKVSPCNMYIRSFASRKYITTKKSLILRTPMHSSWYPHVVR